MEQTEINGDEIRQRQIASSCDSLELLAPSQRHARPSLLAPSGAASGYAASGPTGASGASATFLSMRVCCPAVGHARLLAPSGPAAFGRSGASGASQRGLPPHYGATESGFTARRRRLGRALYPATDAGFE
jgi:hypothetical protein